MVTVGAGGVLPALPGESNEETPASLVMTEIVFPDRTSHYGSLYGGHAMAAMAKAAFIAATRHSRQRVVMASCRRADLESQIHNGELLDVSPAIVSVGRSSMTVAVDLWAESAMSLERRFCGRGEFVMVAIDAEGQPAEIVPTSIDSAAAVRQS